MQTLTLDFLLYAVRERTDLRRDIAQRYRSFEANLAELFRGWLEAESHQPAIPPEELRRPPP